VSIFKNGKEKFQKAMSAAAFAEVGEFDTAREIAGKSKNAHKKVLIVLEGDDLNKRILNYALDLCKRLGGQLEILHKQGPNKVDITKTELWQEFTKKGGQVVGISLGPGESLDTVAAGLIVSATITETVTNVAVWTATVVGGPSSVATDTAPSGSTRASTAVYGPRSSARAWSRSGTPIAAIVASRSKPKLPT
jgi:hypothetical protein